MEIEMPVKKVKRIITKNDKGETMETYAYILDDKLEGVKVVITSPESLGIESGDLIEIKRLERQKKIGEMELEK